MMLALFLLFSQATIKFCWEYVYTILTTFSVPNGAKENSYQSPNATANTS